MRVEILSSLATPVIVEQWRALGVVLSSGPTSATAEIILRNSWQPVKFVSGPLRARVADGGAPFVVFICGMSNKPQAAFDLALSVSYGQNLPLSSGKFQDSSFEKNILSRENPVCKPLGMLTLKLGRQVSGWFC